MLDASEVTTTLPSELSAAPAVIVTVESAEEAEEEPAAGDEETTATGKEPADQPAAAESGAEEPEGVSPLTAPEPPSIPEPVSPPAEPVAGYDHKSFAKAYASPAVRRFARQLGVDLTRILPVGVAKAHPQ